MKRHYLDWAATAIPDQFTSQEEGFFGNPSSLHTEGIAAREVLESARNRSAKVLGVKAENLYFTSGGTESNALFFHSILLRSLLLQDYKSRLLYSAVEHPSVSENCLLLEKLKIPVSVIGVEKDGRVSEKIFSKMLLKHGDTRFAAIMGVNNETGALMDLEKLVSIARQNQNIHVHADLVQAIGKVPVDIKAWDLDSASISSHKLGGPRGIGLLYLKKPLESLMRGGEQEGKIRPGTENTQGALALADALERRADPQIVISQMVKARQRFKYLIENLKKIKAAQRCSLIPQDREEDDPRFSPWILQARFRDVPGAVMVRALDDAGIAVSTGSACSTSSPERPVLSAMGIKGSARLEGIRISQGWSTKKSDMDALLEGIEKVLSFL